MRIRLKTWYLVKGENKSHFLPAFIIRKAPKWKDTYICKPYHNIGENWEWDLVRTHDIIRKLTKLEILFYV